MNTKCKIHDSMMLLNSDGELYCFECEIEKANNSEPSQSAQVTPETKKTIQDLILRVKHTSDKKSARRKRYEASMVLLKTLEIKHKPECVKCMLNCEVKHKEDVEFWARIEGIEPVYNMENCPKE
ncbi:MAG: hypothetical protein GYA34_11965 [Chloroflexi bacterium]|nr:hypothetical protein [Chloroflexota bacterium]